MPKSVVLGGLMYFSLMSRAELRIRRSRSLAAASTPSASPLSAASIRRW